MGLSSLGAGALREAVQQSGVSVQVVQSAERLEAVSFICLSFETLLLQ